MGSLGVMGLCIARILRFFLVAVVRVVGLRVGVCRGW